MPKKATTVRSGAQRNKAKAQKSFEVVRQNTENQEFTDNELQVGATPIINTPTSFVEVPSSSSRSTRRAATQTSMATQEVETENEVATPEVSPEIEALPTSLIKGNVEVPSSSSRSTRRAATQTSMATQEVETENEVATPEVSPEIEALPTSLIKGNVKAPSSSSRSTRRAATRASVATQEVETPEVSSEIEALPTSFTKGSSASARLASRRGQKLQQRTPATLVTAEHYSYVRRDLIIIAVLASIMFIAIIVLYFTIGRG